MDDEESVPGKREGLDDGNFLGCATNGPYICFRIQVNPRPGSESLYGQWLAVIGSRMETATTVAHNDDMTRLVIPILWWMLAVKKHSPRKKSPSAICIRTDNIPTIAKTLHFRKPTNRKKRIRRRVLGDVWSVVRYSRSHDLTRIPIEAVTRLRRRLLNHNTLIRISGLSTLKTSRGGCDCELAMAVLPFRAKVRVCRSMKVWLRSFVA